MIFDPSRPSPRTFPRSSASSAISPIVRDLLDFIQARGKRHFTVPPLREGAGSDDDDD